MLMQPLRSRSATLYVLPLYISFHSRPSASQQISPKTPRSIATVLQVKQHQQERHQSNPTQSRSWHRPAELFISPGARSVNKLPKMAWLSLQLHRTPAFARPVVGARRSEPPASKAKRRAAEDDHGLPISAPSHLPKLDFYPLSLSLLGPPIMSTRPSSARQPPANASAPSDPRPPCPLPTPGQHHRSPAPKYARSRGPPWPARLRQRTRTYSPAPCETPRRPTP